MCSALSARRPRGRGGMKWVRSSGNPVPLRGHGAFPRPPLLRALLLFRGPPLPTASPKRFPRSSSVGRTRDRALQPLSRRATQTRQIARAAISGFGPNSEVRGPRGPLGARGAEDFRPSSPTRMLLQGQRRCAWSRGGAVGGGVGRGALGVLMGWGYQWSRNLQFLAKGVLFWDFECCS